MDNHTINYNYDEWSHDKNAMSNQFILNMANKIKDPKKVGDVLVMAKLPIGIELKVNNGK